MMHPLVRTLLHGLAAWFLMRLLCQSTIGWWIAALITAMAGFTAVYVYLHVHRSEVATRLGSLPGLYLLACGACRLAGLQTPVSDTVALRPGVTDPRTPPDTAAARLNGMPAVVDARVPARPTFAIEHEEHFRRAANTLRGTVVGHDGVVDQIMHHLARSVALRSASETPDSTPLGRFLLIGQSGVGRRFLAQAVGRCLFDCGDLVAFDVAAHATPELAADAAWGIGPGGEPGCLASAVRSRPTRVIVIEHVDQLDPRGIAQLTRILSTGLHTDPVSGSNIDFRSCVFFLLTESGAAALDPAPEDPDEGRDWVDHASEFLQGRTTLSGPLLQSLDGIHHCVPLTRLEQAEIVAQLVDRECARFGLRLAYVEPEFIVDQLRTIDTAYGLATLPARVKASLKEPIYQAKRRGATQLTIDQDSLDSPPASQPNQMEFTS